MTKPSKKNNVYTPPIANPASCKQLSVGSKAAIKLDFPENPITRTVRWTSKNTKVATVTENGTITARKVGTATLCGRTSSGRFVKFKVTVLKGGTRAAMLSVMKSWVGYSEANGKHKGIIDIYNAYGDLPVGYKVKYRDAWCDTCVSAAAIRSGNEGTIGRECGVQRHVQIFKDKGIWSEDGTITPKPGDIIVYAWGRSRQPNNASGSHIGVVEKVSDGKITAIEGNYSDKVKRRTMKVGWGYIRGFARPKYR